MRRFDITLSRQKMWSTYFIASSLLLTTTTTNNNYYINTYIFRNNVENYPQNKTDRRPRHDVNHEGQEQLSTKSKEIINEYCSHYTSYSASEGQITKSLLKSMYRVLF